MNHLTLTIRLNRDAYCPICCSDLLGDTTRVRWGIALCAICYRSVTYRMLWKLCELMASQEHIADVSISQGIIFWAPRSPARPNRPLYFGHIPHPVCDPDAQTAGILPGTVHPACK